MFRLIFRLAMLALIGLIGYEGYLAYGYYDDITTGTRSLEKVERQIDASSVLTKSEADVLALREELGVAAQSFDSARGRTERDPGLRVASAIPGANRQADAFTAIVQSADDLVGSGLLGSEVLLGYVRSTRGNGGFSASEGLAFLETHQGTITQLDATVTEVKLRRADIGGDLLPPLLEATRQLDRMIELVEVVLADLVRTLTAGTRP